MAFGKNIDKRKTNKRNHIIDLFRQRGSISKAQAKKISGYSMDTIISIFETLITDEIIIPSPGIQKAKGRKANYFSLNDKKSIYIGITFNQLGIYSTVISFSLKILGTLFTSLDNVKTEKDFLKHLHEHAVQIISNPIYKDNLSGIGCSIPGDIEPESGILHSYSYLPFLKNLNFNKFLKDLFPDIPIKISHNTTSMITYILKNNYLLKENETVLFISARTGLANGLIHDRKIINSQGEFGHISISDEGELCNCGRRGCLDNYFSYKSFLEILNKCSTTKLTFVHNKEELAELNQLSQLYINNNETAVSMLDKGLQYFSHALLDIINVTAPSLVILTGELLKVYNDPVTKINNIINNIYHDTGLIINFQHTKLEFIDLGIETVSIGICYEMMENDWDYYKE